MSTITDRSMLLFTADPCFLLHIVERTLASRATRAVCGDRRYFAFFCRRKGTYSIDLQGL